MLILEQTVEIHVLRKQGKSLRQISDSVGVSVNTVRKYLKSDSKQRVRYKARIPLVTKLDPYKDYLDKRVKSAHPLILPATVLFKEIRGLGYPGQLTQLRGYLRSLKPVQEPEKLIRFETPPGKQMQVDWIEFRKGKNPLAAFVATLGYSRASYVEFVVNQKIETLMQCHKNAFDYFCGVPAEALYDNMKTVIISRDTYGSGIHRFNSAMLDFAKHYSFTLKVCKPYRAKTKGKVERFNRYLRYSFYNPLSSKLKASGLILDVETANIEVLKWLTNTANTRVHGTTGEVPSERLEIEKSHLQQIPIEYPGITAPCKAIEKQQDLDTITILKPQAFSTEALQHPLSVYDQILEAV